MLRKKNYLGKSTLIEINQTLKSTNSPLQLLCGGGVTHAFIRDCLTDSNSLDQFHGSFSKRVFCDNAVFDLAAQFTTQKDILTAILELK